MGKGIPMSSVSAPPPSLAEAATVCPPSQAEIAASYSAVWRNARALAA